MLCDILYRCFKQIPVRMVSDIRSWFLSKLI